MSQRKLRLLCELLSAVVIGFLFSIAVASAEVQCPPEDDADMSDQLVALEPQNLASFVLRDGELIVEAPQKSGQRHLIKVTMLDDVNLYETEMDTLEGKRSSVIGIYVFVREAYGESPFGEPACRFLVLPPELIEEQGEELLVIQAMDRREEIPKINRPDDFGVQTGTSNDIHKTSAKRHPKKLTFAQFGALSI